ncbi:MAG: sulfatase-like hydrolase/transferase [Thermoanaerobaculia bacterium]|nr:sulfatase-like hydrolase/transferase [Thermoanaerobaculia bacterium]
MSSLAAAVRVALAQWPPLALAWAIHAALLFYLFFTYVPAGVPLSQRLLVGTGLACLVVAEIGLLLAVNVGIELAGLPVPRKDLLDAPKAALVATLIGLLSASILKFNATSVHLRRTDLWFAWMNLRQILAEATPADAAGVLLVPAGVVLLGLGLFFGLRRFRRRAEASPGWGASLAVVAVTVAAAAAGGALYLRSPALALFADAFVPETHWASGLARRPFEPAGARPGEGAGNGREAIAPYRPERRRRPNVVLVMLESIPWKRTFLGAGRAAATPRLEELAGESVVFSRAYTTSTHSDYAQMAILSSLHPRKYDRHDYYSRIEYPRTLIWDALRPAGYATSMFSCQNERWGNMLNYLDTPGLQVLRHSLDWPRARRRGRGTESKVYEETPVAEWKRWRRAFPDEPFFTYFNFQANHFPYELPPEERRLFEPFEIDFPASFLGYPRDKVPVMLNRFYNAMHYADARLGEIVDALRSEGLWQRTVLIVVSDHGEAFYEHGVPTHGTSLLEEQVRSVWMLRAPAEPPRTIDEPVSLLDLAPTLLELLDLPPHGNFQGRGDVLSPRYTARGRPLYFTLQGLTFEDAVLADGWKYVVNWDRRARGLYDLEQDPGETVNLIDRRGDRALALDESLRGFVGEQLAYYAGRRWEEGLYPPRLP